MEATLAKTVQSIADYVDLKLVSPFIRRRRCHRADQRISVPWRWATDNTLGFRAEQLKLRPSRLTLQALCTLLNLSLVPDVKCKIRISAVARVTGALLP